MKKTFMSKKFPDILSDLVQEELEKRTSSGKNVGQNTVAKEIGISSGSLSNYCSGASDPTTTNLIKIPDYFDVTTDYLLGRGCRNPIHTDFAKETGLTDDSIANLAYLASPKHEVPEEKIESNRIFLNILLGGHEFIKIVDIASECLEKACVLKSTAFSISGKRWSENYFPESTEEYILIEKSLEKFGRVSCYHADFVKLSKIKILELFEELLSYYFNTIPPNYKHDHECYRVERMQKNGNSETEG